MALQRKVRAVRKRFNAAGIASQIHTNIICKEASTGKPCDENVVRVARFQRNERQIKVLSYLMITGIIVIIYRHGIPKPPTISYTEICQYGFLYYYIPLSGLAAGGQDRQPNIGCENREAHKRRGVCPSEMNGRTKWMVFHGWKKNGKKCEQSSCCWWAGRKFIFYLCRMLAQTVVDPRWTCGPTYSKQENFD